MLDLLITEDERSHKGALHDFKKTLTCNDFCRKQWVGDTLPNLGSLVFEQIIFAHGVIAALVIVLCVVGSVVINVLIYNLVHVLIYSSIIVFEFVVMSSGQGWGDKRSLY